MKIRTANEIKSLDDELNLFEEDSWDFLSVIDKQEEKLKQEKNEAPQDKVWKQDFVEMLGFEYPNVREVNDLMKNNSFLGCIEDMHLEPYEVPGLLPREPKIETGSALTKKLTSPKQDNQ